MFRVVVDDHGEYKIVEFIQTSSHTYWRFSNGGIEVNSTGKAIGSYRAAREFLKSINLIPIARVVSDQSV